MCKPSGGGGCGVKDAPGSLAPDKTRNAQVEPFKQPQSRVVIMDGQNLLHLQLHVDPLEPRRGVLELLRRLRPQWTPQDVHMKVTATTVLRTLLHVSDWLLVFSQ